MIIYMYDRSKKNGQMTEHQNAARPHGEADWQTGADSKTFIQNTIVITNRALVEGDYLQQLRKVAAYHPKALILREKDLDDAAYEQLAEQVINICNAQQVPCFMHSHFAAAEKLDCKNMHVSISGLKELHNCANQFERISVSCHSMEDVRFAIEHGASQIILGTIFETECKKGLKGKGLTFVREIAGYCHEHGHFPVYAIGGINPGNLEQVIEAGAEGGCMMSYMMRI